MTLVNLSLARHAVRLSAYVAYERVIRPKARAAGDVPYSVAAITPQWLTAILCRDVPGAAVSAFRVSDGSSGTNVRHRLVLDYNAAGRAAGLPTSVFAKSTPTLATRLVTGTTGQARVEAQFYAKARPRLDIEIPQGYFAVWDPVSCRTMLILEDVKAARGAQFLDYTAPVTREMAESMVDLLADFHGVFQGLGRDDTQLRLPGYARWFRAGIDKLAVDKAHDLALARAGDHVPAAVAARWHDILPAALRSLGVHDKLASTYIHSDVHIGNWYRTSTGNMGLTDWQCGARGHWSRDLSYALVAALTIEDRRLWESDLVRRYVARLGARTGQHIDFDEAWRLYRGQMFSALFMWTPTLVHSVLLPNMQTEECSLTMIARMTVAIDDLKSFDAV